MQIYSDQNGLPALEFVPPAPEDPPGPGDPDAIYALGILVGRVSAAETLADLESRIRLALALHGLAAVGDIQYDIPPLDELPAEMRAVVRPVLASAARERIRVQVMRAWLAFGPRP